MVLAALGQPVAEEVLRVVTDCSPLGTDAFQLVEAARQLGFPASRKYTLVSLDDLTTLLAEGALADRVRGPVAVARGAEWTVSCHGGHCP